MANGEPGPAASPTGGFWAAASRSVGSLARRVRELGRAVAARFERPRLRFGLIGPGSSGKTNAIKELARISIREKRPDFGLILSAVGFDAAEGDVNLVDVDDYVDRTVQDFVLYDGRSIVTGRGGGRVALTILDTRGQTFEVPDFQMIPANVRDEVRKSGLLILFVDPATLQAPDGARAGQFGKFARYIEEVLTANPWAAVAVAFSQADEYGTTICPAAQGGGPPFAEDDLRIFDPDGRVAAALEGFWSAGDGRNKAWNEVLKAVSTTGSSPPVMDLRKWVMDRSRILWEVVFLHHRPRLLSAYIVSALPVRVGEVSEPYARRGLLQLVADFTASYRCGLGRARWRWAVAGGGLLLGLFALFYGLLPGLDARRYRAVAPPGTPAAEVAQRLAAAGQDRAPWWLPPWRGDDPGRDLVVRRATDTYGALARNLRDRSPGAGKDALDRWLTDIEGAVTAELDRVQHDRLTPREAALIERDDPSRGLWMDLTADGQGVAALARSLRDALAAPPGQADSKLTVAADELAQLRKRFDGRAYCRNGERVELWTAMVAGWAGPGVKAFVRVRGPEYLEWLRKQPDAAAEPLTALGADVDSPYSRELITAGRESLPKENRDLWRESKDNKRWVEGLADRKFTIPVPVPPSPSHGYRVHLLFRARGSVDEFVIESPSLAIGRPSGNVVSRQKEAGGVAGGNFPNKEGEVWVIPAGMELTGLWVTEPGGRTAQYTVRCRNRVGVWFPAGVDGLYNADAALTVADRATGRLLDLPTLPPGVREEVLRLKPVDPYQLYNTPGR